ncbi:hypothetical protein E6C27_scaffold442G00040 [Cucumis melo var. makuwa]|nr:hypothetical protein E6C27_scaffold442G00040 [Cucumis melo var. makuwa]
MGWDLNDGNGASLLEIESAYGGDDLTKRLSFKEDAGWTLPGGDLRLHLRGSDDKHWMAS